MRSSLSLSSLCRARRDARCAAPQPSSEELCDTVERGRESELSDCLLRGADPNAVVQDYYCTSGTCTSALWIAVIGGFGGRVSLLAAAGADLNVLDESNGNTVLMELARKGQTRMCRRLLEVGADHTVKDEDGRAALDLAREKGWDTTAAVLEAWANGTRDPALLHRTTLGLPSDATEAQVLEAEAEYKEPRLLGDAPCLVM